MLFQFADYNFPINDMLIGHLDTQLCVPSLSFKVTYLRINICLRCLALLKFRKGYMYILWLEYFRNNPSSFLISWLSLFSQSNSSRLSSIAAFLAITCRAMQQLLLAHFLPHFHCKSNIILLP